MKRTSSTLLFAFFLSLLLLQRPIFASKKSYVVYLGDHNHNNNGGGALGSPSPSEAYERRVTESHYDLLGSVLGDKKEAQDAIFYSYTKHINGFAAILEEETAKAIAEYPKLVSVFPNRGHKLHTTRSWHFMGLERDGGDGGGDVVPRDSLWTKARFGEDTIIANFDSGVWPESESFKDEGLGPIPSKWKGICQNDFDKSFTCSRKLIGARYFNKGYAAFVGKLNSTFNTPRDTDGHGSHTLSTAGGSFVPGANVFGYGNGTAKGGSPRARVAAYKVCWPPVNGSECFDADILAAFDAAIHDGVDVLSISLGGYSVPFLFDGLAIGSFHAVRNGIAVSCSAGNAGPDPGTVSNVAPWIFTVGASSMDREFPAYATFGDKKLKGQSLSPNKLAANKLYPMISSKDAKAANQSESDAELCFLGSLDPEKVKDKIVVCLRGTNARVEKGEAVLTAGGAGMVLANDFSTGNEIIADAHVLPATHISYSDGQILFSYLQSTKSPHGYITKPITELNTKPAPYMAAFSSPGPNIINPEILKPDITAPGLSVIAAYTRASSPTQLAFDHRRVSYNSESGTSMSCPHIAGVVGLLKTLYPHWSPAAIKSAIMTSARTRDNKKEPVLDASFIEATPLNYGSGHVRPNRAMDPGLVYDLTTTDYLNFLCAQGYNTTEMGLFTQGTTPYKCPAEPINLLDFNYPSITVPSLSGSATVCRTLKNVGPPGTYTVRVKAPTGIQVAVSPKSLKFDSVGEEKKFWVTLKAKNSEAASEYVFGRLIWSDGKRYVRSPLAVKSWLNPN